MSDERLEKQARVQGIVKEGHTRHQEWSGGACLLSVLSHAIFDEFLCIRICDSYCKIMRCVCFTN